MKCLTSGFVSWFLVALPGMSFAQEVLRVHDGEESFDQMSSVVRIADLDADAVDDYCIAAPIWGNSWGLIEVRSGTSGDLIHRIEGPPPDSSRLGWSVADAGDFDGDGTHDIVAGAMGDPTGGTERGRVDVYSGATGLLLARYCCGSVDQDRIGTTVAGVGDVDGDGYDDVMAAGQAQYALVLGGPDAHVIRTHWATSHFGTVASLDDVDRDGRPDYLIGWPRNSSNGTWTGAVIAYSGADGSMLYAVYGDKPYDGDFHGDNLGWSVVAVGDLDLDGIVDFAAGAPGGSGSTWATGPGFVRLYSGATGVMLDEFLGDTSNSTLGLALGAGGDINADGVRDWLGGAPSETIDVFGQGSANMFSGATRTGLWKLLGTEVLQDYGQWLTILDDLDGDGYEEFAIGDKEASFTEQYAGRVTIYRGAPGDAVRICPASPNSTGVPTRLNLDGPISLSYARLSLVASDGPAGQFGLFFYGGSEISDPFGNGTLCAGAPIFRLGPPLLLDGLGEGSRAIDFAAPPVGSGAGAWTAGSTWILQFWHRDPQGGGAFFNLSDALRLTPTP